MQIFTAAKRKWIHLFIYLFFASCTFGQSKVTGLLCENLENPLAIDETQPRLSWQLVSDKRNVMQAAYEIKIATGKSTVWNSGKVISDSCVHVVYKGLPRQGGQKYFWQVRVWDNSGKVSAWSEPASFQMGILTATGW